AVHKKAAFLKEVARELNLPSLEVRASRFEDLGTLDVEWVTLRAVRLDPKLLATIRRNVPRGTLAAFLGEEDAGKVGGSVQLHAIPGSERRVIAVGKCSTWNARGTISKN